MEVFSNKSFSTYARRHIEDRSINYPVTRHHGARIKIICYFGKIPRTAIQTGSRFRPAPHHHPLQLLRPFPLAGNQQWSSRFPLKLGKQPLYVSGKTVQYQERKCAYDWRDQILRFKSWGRHSLVLVIVLCLIMRQVCLFS